MRTRVLAPVARHADELLRERGHAPLPAGLTPHKLRHTFASVDSFKTELMADRIWRTRSQLELAVVEYVGWFNQARLHESLGDLPPAEFEALCAAQTDLTTSIK